MNWRQYGSKKAIGFGWHEGLEKESTAGFFRWHLSLWPFQLIKVARFPRDYYTFGRIGRWVGQWRSPNWLWWDGYQLGLYKGVRSDEVVVKSDGPYSQTKLVPRASTI